MFSIDFVHSDEEQKTFLSTLESQGWIINLIATLDYGVKYQATKAEKECRFVIYKGKKNHTTKIVAEKHSPDFKAILEDIEKNLAHTVTEVKEDSKFASLKTKDIPEYDKRIGSDESGKGDYFGPLVVAAVYLRKEDEVLLEELNISDSKTHNNNVNQRTKNELIRILPKNQWAVKMLSPREFNAKFKAIKNTNVILSILHQEAVTELLNKNKECKNVIVDQFAQEDFINNSFKRAGVKGVEVFQTPKAERDKAVAAASMIARGIFLDELQKLSSEYAVELPLGAGNNVDQAASTFVKKNGMERLERVAKVNFKNTLKLK